MSQNVFANSVKSEKKIWETASMTIKEKVLIGLIKFGHLKSIRNKSSFD